MKKILSFTLIALSLAMLLFLFSCGEEEIPSNDVEICLDGTHEYLAWEIEKDAVCNSKGIRTRTCVVCKQYTEKQYFTNKDAHNFVDLVCTYCGKEDAPENVGFVLSDDKTYYILYSIEDENAKDYSIPPKHNGLPVKVIASGAFEKCTAIEEIVVPSSVEKIEEGAFAGCYSLKKLTVPFVGESRKEENSVFGYIFGSKAFKGSIGITQFIGKDAKEFWLPATLVDVTVTDGTLYEGCFENCTRLKRVDYQGTSKRVYDKAFNGCYTLTTVTLSESINKYGDRVFQNCTALDTFPLEGIREIGDYCFAGCYIEYLSIPESLTFVGEAAFADCKKLKSAHISKGLKKLSDNMFQDCILLEKVELDDGVETIGEASFAGCSALTEVLISNTVTEIKEIAFKECVGLKEITIPGSIERLDKGVFQDCISLKTVTLGEGIEILGELSFSNCSSLEAIDIPASVKEFEESVFADCSSLKAININPMNRNFATVDGNIYNISRTKLLLYSPGNNQTSFVIPDGVTSIDPSAFMNATALNEVVFPGTMKKIPKYLFDQNDTLKAVVIGDGVQIIEKGAFQGCKSLTTVKIYGVTSIEEEAFTQCKMLKTVIIEDVNEIGKGAFHSCPLLNSVTITSVDLVGENAFAKCYGLTEIIFGSGSDIIVGTEAFSDCTQLENLTISSSVKNIGEFAFSNCTKLKNVNIEEGLAYIGEACFRACSNLTYISIPASLQTVNAYAFEGCISLETFDVASGSIFKTIDGHLVDRSNTLIVYAYSQLAEEITIPEGIVSIGTFVFRNVLTLKKVNFPSSLETIGNEAFFNSGLKEINLNKVKTIGKYAFGSCLALTTATISSSVTTIEDYAFQYCANLSSIYINDSVLNMGNGVFHAKYEEGAPLVSELMVYIEFDTIPETWNKGWDAGRNDDITYILGRYVKD